MEDKRKRCVAFEDAAKRMLKYLEDSEDLKVGLSELIVREDKSSSRSSSKKRMMCTSPVRRGGRHNVNDWWERRCLDLMQEVELLSD